MNRNYRLEIALASLAALILVINPGCNRSPSDIAQADYFTTGVLVQVMDHNDAHVSARFWRDLTPVVDGTVRFANTDMPYFDSNLIDSAYQHVFRPVDTLAGETHYFVVSDGTQFNDSLLVNVVDTFSITDNFDPQLRFLPGGGPVSFEWTGAANAEGYFIAAVKADTAYTGVGYSALADEVANAGTIPADAFVDPFTSELDTGLYYVYVYAFSGSPDSAQASHWLPTPLPMQFEFNIDQQRFKGRFGTLTVTAHDSVLVAMAQ